MVYIYNALGKGMAWLKHWNRKESEKLENKPSCSAKDSLIWSRKEGVLAVGHISSVISTLTAFDRVYMRSPRKPEEAMGERNSTRLSKIWLEKSPKSRNWDWGKEREKKKRDFFALISASAGWVLRSRGGYKCHREGLKGFLFRYQDYFIFSPTSCRVRFPGFPAR